MIDKKMGLMNFRRLIAYLPLDDSHIRSSHPRCSVKEEEVFLKIS